MSTYGHCHRGGQEGIVTTYSEMLELAAIMETEYVDEYIPLPGIDLQAQVKKIEEHVEDTGYDNSIYWETETGAHGWCNRDTGKVVQWG